MQHNAHMHTCCSIQTHMHTCTHVAAFRHTCTQSKYIGVIKIKIWVLLTELTYSCLKNKHFIN
jgi:kynurenine formamidase